MRINHIDSNIKCDSVLCFEPACHEIITDSYKGNQYLCKHCYNKYKNLFKENKKQNEK